MEIELDIIKKALLAGRTMLSEHESKILLQSHGIPVTRELEIHDEKELMQAVKEISFPCVLKACSPHLSHKTEKNLIQLDIRNIREAREAFRNLIKAEEDDSGTVLVQEMLRGTRELAIGLTRDQQFGTCVMFGLGGIFTEIFKDVSFRTAPIKKYDAIEMMNEIKAYKILKGVRGMPSVDIDQLAEILIIVSDIALKQEKIREIDINPIILVGAQPVAADALIVLNPQAPNRCE